MDKAKVNQVDVRRDWNELSSNLRNPVAEKFRVKCGLALEIARAMQQLDLTQCAAAQRMGISQPKVSGLLKGDFENISERKLMDCLTRLGYDIEIQVRPARQLNGKVLLHVAKSAGSS
ncbi:putative XRE-type DNA-binding protein [Oxalobacteraceae bacterium GrIS 2.11]